MIKEAHRIHGHIGGGFFNPPIGPSSLSQYELNAVAPPYNPKCQRKKYFANSPKSGSETNKIDSV